MKLMRPLSFYDCDFERVDLKKSQGHSYNVLLILYRLLGRGILFKQPQKPWSRARSTHHGQVQIQGQC